METIPLTEVPLVSQEDDVGEILLEGLEKQEIELKEDDLLVIAQTIISKAEGNIVNLTSIEPSSRSRKIANEIDEDPRKVEVILDQSEKIVRSEHVLISQTKHGFVCADAGVDSSNVEPGKVTLLPDNPDQSAERIRRKIEKETGKRIAVIISDSWGRPFRLGARGFAIGIAGIKPLEDLEGEKDSYGGELETTTIAPPDSFAAAASLEMGEADEEIPAVIIRDSAYEPGEGSIPDLIRPQEKDLFR